MVFNAAAEMAPEIVERDLTPYGLSEKDVVARMELKDGKLYKVSDRMLYVDRILDQYHRLMGKKTDYMIEQLRRIEGMKNA